MKTKIIPFDIELAKKIQAGEVEGRIVTDDNLSVRLLCTDANLWGGNSVVVLIKGNTGKDMIFDFDSDGKRNSFIVPTYLIIELPEEESKPDSFSRKLHDTAEVLATPKHEFKPFDKVLMRSPSSGYVCWYPHHYCRYIPNAKDAKPHVALDGFGYEQCIPYEGNESLCGTTNKPKEE